MAWILESLRNHPEVAFFLVLGLGYLFGRIAFGSFKLGAVSGTLLAGVLVGQFGISIPDVVKQCFFLLFLFAIGFRTGPQFFRGLRSDGLAHTALAAIVATTGLLVAWAVALLFGYDAGTAAGLVAGALTESATLGTALDAIARLDLGAARQAELSNHMPVAFAVTYLVGVMGAAWVLSQLAPWLLRINLAESCRELEEQMQATGGPASSARREFEMRAYAIDPGSRHVGCRILELESVSPQVRIFVEQLRSNGEIRAAHPDLVLKQGDVVAIVGRREHLVEVLEAKNSGLREVDDRELLDVPASATDVVVTNAAIGGRRLADIGREQLARGVFLRRIRRGGTELGRLPTTVIERGDVLTLVGSEASLARAVQAIGISDEVTDVTDMSAVAAGIVVGALVGLPALHMAGVEIGLSLPVGVLLGGLVCGWLRSRWPRWFGPIPSPTLWIFESIGLTGFVAVVGLNAGPDFVAGLKESGLSLVLAGFLAVSIALLIGVAVGRWLFRMHPGVLLGVCAGACTATPALAAIQESARSSVPSIGYGIAYAVGNVLLALWGTVIVALMASP